MACTYTLPAVSGNDTCQTIKRGQIYKMWLTRPTVADVLADSTDLAEWTTRIDQSAVIPGSGAAPIRELSGIGSTDAGDVNDIDIPLDQIYSFPGNKVVTFTVMDMTAENIAAAIAWRDAGTTQQKIWFQADDLLYGGDTGINGSLRADLVVPEGRTDPQRIVLTFTTKQSIVSGITTPHPVL